MAIMANIVLKDAATPTPNDHTFNPTSLSGNKGEYRELAVTPFVNQQSISVDLTPASASSAGWRGTWRLVQALPLDDEGPCCNAGVPTPTNWVSIQFFSNKLATRSDLLNLIAELQDLVADSQFTGTILGEGLR